MLRICSVLCVVPTVISIIVTDPPPLPTDYKYSYTIEDPSTGDSKSQHEVRQGDVVSGAYSVVDPDGTKRIVEYTADSKHGFKAVVREEPANVPVVTSSPPTKHGNYPQYYSNRLYEKPMYDTNNESKLSQYYRKLKYVAQDAGYFTPANEIKPENESFDHGQYFIPSKK